MANWETGGFTSNEAMHSWIRTNYVPGMGKDVSVNAALNTLKDMGLGIRRQTFQGYVRDALGLQKYETKIAALKPGSLIPKSWMSVRTDINMSCVAQYRARVQVWDLETGETSWKPFAVANDMHLTKEDAEGQMMERFRWETPTSNYAVFNAEIYQVWVSDPNKLQFGY